MRRFTKLIFPRSNREIMIAHARTALPNECCGILAGTIEANRGVIAINFQLGNDLNSPSAYRSSPGDLLAASKAARAANLEFLAIYHSHPLSAAIPSQTDLHENNWGDTCAHIIVSCQAAETTLRAWWLGTNEFSECEMELA